LITEIRDMEMAEAARVSPDALDELTDEELLERFTSQREEAAFTALVRRHAALVLGVCRRVLHHAQDAEDAFQAVFCVLARKAEAIRRRRAVASWLYAVAYRVASKARAARGRRPMPQGNLPDIPAPSESPECVWRDIQPILDQEVNRLPEKYRQAFVLCYLEGKTNEQAAAELGCPLGTVLSRLARARDRLRARLTRRGLTLSAGGLAAALGGAAAQGAVPSVLTEAAVKSGLAFAWGTASGGAVSAGVRALAGQFLRSLVRTRLLKAGAGLVALAAGIAVLLLLLRRPPLPPPPPPPLTDRARLQGAWQVLSMDKAGLVLQNPGVRFTFAGDQGSLVVPGVPTLPWSYTLDPSQEPKAIDFAVATGTARGIYRLDGDRLTLCVNHDPASGKRPTAFQTSPDTPSVFVYVLRHESAARDGEAAAAGK
jgi:RNA polymerase sigma factor (sigma-70 family)